MAVVSGGTTLIDNGTLDSAVPVGKIKLLSTQTASSSASIEFTSSIDSTYDSYIFKFINLHPQNDGRYFKVVFSSDSGSTYTENINAGFFNALHSEDDTSYATLTREDTLLTALTYPANLISSVGNDSDENLCGTFQLFNPSSSTYSTTWLSRISSSHDFPMASDNFATGYVKTASAIDAIKFYFHTGNIDDGIIKMYGVS